jgi:hypothetical protein
VVVLEAGGKGKGEEEGKGESILSFVDGIFELDQLHLAIIGIPFVLIKFIAVTCIPFHPFHFLVPGESEMDVFVWSVSMANDVNSTSHCLSCVVFLLLQS